MNRIQPQDPAKLTGKAKELTDGIQAKMGSIPNVFKLMANAPVVLESYLNFSGALAQGVLSPRIREQIALVVAEANKCEYCLSAHSVIGKGAGLSDEEMMAARKGEAMDPKAEAIIQFARKMVIQRADMQDADIETLKRTGVTDAELAEIIANVSLNLFTNYFNHVAAPEVDFPMVKPLAAATV